MNTILNRPVIRWMEADGPDGDVVISSRVRLARNLAMLPFPHLLRNDKNARAVIDKIRKAVADIPGFSFTLCSELSPLERQILVEKHLISPEHAQNDSSLSGVVTDDTGSICIMVNEEDHLRIQCLLSGLQLNQAYKYADDIDNRLEQVLEYAFDEKRGYITACPTNVGTGMRASVMLHLPAVAMTNQQGNIFGSIAQLGLTVRGLYGEGTEALGNLYQISNQITLGQTEEDIINNLWSITLHIVRQERMIREKLKKEMQYQIEDRLWRSYGVMTNARMINSQEALALLSDVRLGVDMGILPSIPARVLNELMVAIRPAHLQRSFGREMNSLERDLARAEIIKERLLSRK